MTNLSNSSFFFFTLFFPSLFNYLLIDIKQASAAFQEDSMWHFIIT